MRQITIALFFALVLFVATATAKHPLASSEGNTGHPMAPEKARKQKECVKYITCQVEDVSKDDFRRGAFFSKKAYCVTCGLKIYNESLKNFISLGYEIVHVEYQGSLIRVLLKHPKK